MKKTFFSCLLTLAATLAMALPAKAVQPSGTLPVLTITTDNNVPVESKDNYVKATYSLDPKGAEGIEALEGTTQIKGRGNYTWWGFDKKPYRLKLDKKAAFMGMKKSKHYTLLAHADDNLGFLREPAGFFISRAVGLDWTPDMQPVELILNGDYLGLYFVVEQIRIDQDRVNIYDQEDEEATPDPTGGWLCEIDNYDEDPAEQIKITEGDGTVMRITHKSPEIINADQEAFLRSQYEAIDRAIYQSDPASADLDALVDIASLAKYYVVQEILDNYESFHGSCYMTRDRGEDAKWKFGPVWDFGSTMFDADSRQFIYQGREHHQHWIGQAVKFNSVKDAYKAVFKEFVDNHYSELLDYLDEFCTRIKTAAKADAERWPQYGNNDMDDDLNAVHKFLNNRVKWLCGQWGVPSPDVPVEADIYLRGNHNTWGCDDANRFRSIGDNKYEARDITLAGDFKVASSDWKTVDFGGDTASQPVADKVTTTLKKIGTNLYAEGHFEYVLLSYAEGAETAELTLYSQYSGIDSAVTDTVGISVNGKTLTATARVSVHDLSGRLVAADTTEATLAPGIYIVDCGTQRVKILIR